MLGGGIHFIMEKAGLFIDGGYFNKIKNNLGTRDIDFLKLSDSICNIINVKRLRTYYYHCMPIKTKNDKEDDRRISRMESFLTKLKRLPRFEIKLGKLQMIGGKFRQKMVDVLMSIDIMDMCFDKQISNVIIVAGDADFVPAIKKAKSYGAIVHLFYHPSSVHNELLDNVDELHEIDKELISEL